MLRFCALSAFIVVMTLLGLLTYMSAQVHTSGLSAHQAQPVTLSKEEEDAAVTSLRVFLRHRTISAAGSPLSVEDASPFRAAREHLMRTYHGFLSRSDVSWEVVNEHSLLVQWTGRMPSLQAVLLNGHYDVVPPGNETAWLHGPFSGDLEQGLIWGRGAIDMKGSVIAMFEALLHLHNAGHTPRRTLLFTVGHDEEVGGPHGAAAIASRLAQRGTRVAVVFDEGMSVLSDGLGVLARGPVALVGTAEKGRAAFKVVVETNGGHASMPPTNGAHAPHVMARFISALSRRQPPLTMQGPVTDMLRAVAPHAPFILRGLLANVHVWPLGGLLARVLASMGPTANALVRSTAVPTVVHMGGAHNVIPDRAEAIVDMRVLQGQGGTAPLRFMELRARDAARPGARVRVEPMGDGSIPDAVPSAVTPAQGVWWEGLVRAIQEALVAHGSDGSPLGAGMPVLPGLLMGRTDSANLAGLADHGVYRFLPLCLNRTAGDNGMVHGTNERLPTVQFLSAVRYYVRLLEVMTSL